MKINKHQALSIVTFSVFDEKKDDTNVDAFYCACLPLIYSFKNINFLG